MSDKGRRYNQEFKCETAKLIVDKARSVPSGAADIGVTEQTLYRWVNQYRKGL